MYFTHSSADWQQFPQLVPGVLVLDNVRPEVEVSARLDPWYERARERLRRGPESELAEISAWRRAYAQMGLKPTQYRSAAEALLRRFRRGEALPRLHPLVDLCNAISLAFALPLAVLDLARVEGYVEVRHARGDEQHLAFDGSIETPEPGEVSSPMPPTTRMPGAGPFDRAADRSSGPRPGRS
jgi:DNA/RNA-binding domain of Phe-tRNA-synthetase-like protein